MENERERIAKEICNLGLILLSCKYDGFVKCYQKCSQFKEMLKIADWHISELAKAKQEGRKDAAREILYSHYDYYEHICQNDCMQKSCPHYWDKVAQSILNEEAEVNHAE